MKFALSTRWNAHRHADGEALVQEILDMGFERLELGYDLRQDLVPGVRTMIERYPGLVNTVHNFCPVPAGVMRGHPELWTLSDLRDEVRSQALTHTTQTIRFAAGIGAQAVVLHSGNVKMRRYTPRLIELHQAGKLFTAKYERLKMKMQIQRERKVPVQLDHLRRSLEQLLPVLEECNIRLAIENLPSWESIPTEMELTRILEQFQSPRLGYWHDMGHGQVRQNLGLINHERWLERLQPWLVGMHIHDVIPPSGDHLMPPKGAIDFTRFRPYGTGEIFRVLEPSPYVSRADLVTGFEIIKRAWGENPEPKENESVKT
ncbi:MAG: TIM barrel protein [Kiritimatiellae bacterium]|nr:TIM barrel protein [Kiritimatiellia bacterium]